MVTDPFPTAFLPPFLLRRRIIGCVCASLAGSSRSVPFGTPFPLASWQSPHPIYPCRKVLFNCQRTGGKRSPHFCSRKNRHFGNQFPKFFDSQKYPLNTIGKKNGIFTTIFRKKLILLHKNQYSLNYVGQKNGIFTKK